MRVAALVHSQGFLLDNIFHPLEVAYANVDGFRNTFYVASPVSYTELKRLSPDARVSTVVSTRAPHTTESVRCILREYYEILAAKYGGVCIGTQGRELPERRPGGYTPDQPGEVRRPLHRAVDGNVSGSGEERVSLPR